MASTIKVNNIQNQCGANIINESANTITIGASGDTINLASGASQTGFGRTGTVDWDTTAKTASFTAVSGNGYFVNTTSGAITVTMPASPSAGDIVGIKDYAGTFETNSVTMGRNGSNIDGTAADATLSTNQLSVFFVYVDGTQGWKATQSDAGNYGARFITATGGTVTCCGDYKIHTFTSPGTFTVTCGGNSSGSDTVDYLVVAGGGGAAAYAGGGGGAGGYRVSATTYCGPSLANCVSALPVTATGYPITVGAGGAATTLPQGTTADASAGNNSVFSTITSQGGGGSVGHGGPAPTSPTDTSFGAGGSGSGGSAGNPGGCGTYIARSGNTPPVSPPQGNDGGTAWNSPGSPAFIAAGGGGAGASGVPGETPSNPTTSGNGGAGDTNSINGTPTVRGGGGGGGSYATPQTRPGQGAGGSGGGGNGGYYGFPTVAGGDAGTANTGGGGGGGGRCTDSNGGAGGSGIVIIRYKFQ
jgi:hypothetical protein